MPDPFHLLILIVTFLASVVLGGLIVGGILTASFELRPFDSQWISAFGTVLAAVGTVFTLCFLIYQNASQAEELRQERKDRKDHEDEQKNMWQEQREMLTFQKLQMHKSLFNDLLSEIEKNLGVHFYNRNSLYKKIFSGNGFETFNAKLNPIQVEAGSLQDIQVIHKNLINELSNFDKNNSKYVVHSHLETLFTFSSLLHITLPFKRKFGDITTTFGSQTVFLINMFSPNDTISIYEEVLEQLCDFGGLPHQSSRVNWETSFYLDALHSYSFSQLNHREFHINLSTLNHEINIIYLTYRHLKYKYQQRNPDFDNLIHLFEDLFYSKLGRVSDYESVLLLKQCAESFITTINTTPTSDHNLSTYKDSLEKTLIAFEKQRKLLRPRNI